MTGSFRRISSGLAPLLVGVIASIAWGQSDVSSSSEIRDSGGMFSAEAVRKAGAELVSIERKYRVPITIETIESLKGEPIADAARRMAKRLGVGAKGMYVLMSKQDHKIFILASRDYPELDNPTKRNVILEAFFQEFRRDDFDGGLQKGIAAIDKTVSGLKPATGLPPDRPAGATEPAAAAATEPPGLIERDRIHLTLAGARRVLAGAEAKAREKVYKMNIAVVDDGGHLLAFARMDGARPASANTALTKAVTAATFRSATGPLPAGSTTPDLLLSLSVQNAAAASGGKITTLPGGIPIVVDGQIIGAVGVGGGSGEQDVEVAKAGVSALLAEIQAPKPAK